MDIQLLSKMVKELILDNDKVALPGLGAFVAEVVPSTFSDRGYTINPPYRRLTFRSGAEPDMILAQFYAANNGIGADVAGQILEGFVREMARSLEQNRVLQLPGLGRLRAGRDGNIFFVANEDLDIYPAGFGLEPISLKSHQKPSSFDFSTLVAPESALSADSSEVDEPSPAMPSVAECPDGSDPVSADAPMADSEPTEQGTASCRGRSAARKAGIALLVLVIVASLVVGVFEYLVHFQPELLDRLLYTEEELELIKYFNR